MYVMFSMYKKSINDKLLLVYMRYVYVYICVCCVGGGALDVQRGIATSMNDIDRCIYI